MRGSLLKGLAAALVLAAVLAPTAAAKLHVPVLKVKLGAAAVLAPTESDTALTASDVQALAQKAADRLDAAIP